MRTFKCPKCDGNNITQIVTEGTRTSSVLKVDSIDPNNFICHSPKFDFKNPDSRTFYECTDCGEYLGSNVKKIISSFFIRVNNTTQETSPPEFNKNSPDDLGQDLSHLYKLMNSKPVKYKIKPLKKCYGDSPSVREAIDMINFIIASTDAQIEIVNNDSDNTKFLNKIIKERPYLFERHY